MLVCLLVSALSGCDHGLVSQVATLSGTYAGDVVAIMATGFLHELLGIDDDTSAGTDAQDDGHSHETEPLHEHEH
jgi:hypothetical protein